MDIVINTVSQLAILLHFTNALIYRSSLSIVPKVSVFQRIAEHFQLNSIIKKKRD
jgi:hypothetical protein